MSFAKRFILHMFNKRLDIQKPEQESVFKDSTQQVDVAS